MLVDLSYNLIMMNTNRYGHNISANAQILFLNNIWLILVMVIASSATVLRWFRTYFSVIYLKFGIYNYSFFYTLCLVLWYRIRCFFTPNKNFQAYHSTKKTYFPSKNSFNPRPSDKIYGKKKRRRNIHTFIHLNSI